MYMIYIYEKAQYKRFGNKLILSNNRRNKIGEYEIVHFKITN